MISGHLLLQYMHSLVLDEIEDVVKEEVSKAGAAGDEVRRRLSPASRFCRLYHPNYFWWSFHCGVR